MASSPRRSSCESRGLARRPALEVTRHHWAAHRGHLLVVQCLCEHGADKEARDVDGTTLLLCVALLSIRAYLSRSP